MQSSPLVGLVEAQAGGSRVQGLDGLQTECKNIQGNFVISYLKVKSKRESCDVRIQLVEHFVVCGRPWAHSLTPCKKAVKQITSLLCNDSFFFLMTAYSDETGFKENIGETSISNG